MKTAIAFLLLAPFLLAHWSIAASTASVPLTAIHGLNILTQSRETLELSNPRAALGTVLVFLSAKCPCSASHEPTLKTLSEEFPQFQFIGIHSNRDEEMSLTQKHFMTSALPFPVIEDQNSALANTFGALKTPHVFLVKKNQILFQGGVDDCSDASLATKHYLRDALQAVSQGKTPPVQQARALGCILRRS